MEDRVKNITTGNNFKGDYIIYWMQSSQRTRYNYSLEYAVLESNRLNKPLIVIFNLFADYPEANYRHYYFMIQGLFDIRDNLKNRKIEFIVTYGDLIKNISNLSQNASTLICDKGYLKTEREWRRSISKNIKCTMVEVEGNLVVPVEITSPKEEYAARTIRSKINRVLDDYLYDFQYEEYQIDLNKGDLIEKFKFQWKEVILQLVGTPKKVADSLPLDKSVDKVKSFQGGEKEARRRLESFIEENLDLYDKYGSCPEKDSVSHLSPYLHFGHISSIEIAQKIIKAKTTANKESVESFLEELIIRRELSFNFIYYNEGYDKWEGITYPWAYDSLKLHSVDEREFIYNLDEFERGITHDIYWNAAQKEMVKSGFMHGYMRMYWCKKILEWSPSPEKAYETAIYLNNKYFLDGRDPNSYTGVAWCFGKHDRGWKERAVYGKIRCMMASGLKRKFDMDAYINRVENL